MARILGARENWWKSTPIALPPASIPWRFSAHYSNRTGSHSQNRRGPTPLPSASRWYCCSLGTRPAGRPRVGAQRAKASLANARRHRPSVVTRDLAEQRAHHHWAVAFGQNTRRVFPAPHIPDMRPLVIWKRLNGEGGNFYPRRSNSFSAKSFPRSRRAHVRPGDFFASYSPAASQLQGTRRTGTRPGFVLVGQIVRQVEHHTNARRCIRRSRSRRSPGSPGRRRVNPHSARCRSDVAANLLFIRASIFRRSGMLASRFRSGCEQKPIPRDHSGRPAYAAHSRFPSKALLCGPHSDTAYGVRPRPFISAPWDPAVGTRASVLGARSGSETCGRRLCPP